MSDKSETKAKNWFVRHKAATAVLAVLAIVIIAAAANGGDKTKTSNNASAKSQAPSTTSKTTTKAADTAPATRQVTGTATTLGAGTFTGGKDVAVGLYDVTPGAGQSGNFMVSGADTYNEILGSDASYGSVPMVRVHISDGDKIEISGLAQVAFAPVTTAFATAHSSIDLYAGIFTVGEDVGAGHYVVTPGSGQSGNFIVSGHDSYNEILGGDSAYGGVPNVTVSLTKGDKVEISGLSQVTFTAN